MPISLIRGSETGIQDLKVNGGKEAGAKIDLHWKTLNIMRQLMSMFVPTQKLLSCR